MVLAQSHHLQSVFASLKLSMVLALCSSAPSWHLVLALALAQAPLPLPLPLPLAQHFCASDPVLPCLRWLPLLWRGPFALPTTFTLTFGFFDSVFYDTLRSCFLEVLIAHDLRLP